MFENESVTFSWLSGLIDCDGSICLGKGKTKGKVYTSARLIFYNSNRKIVEKVSEIFECSVCERLTKPINESKPKPYYIASISSKSKIHRILTKCYPYLIVKQKRAREVLDWIESKPRRADLTFKFSRR